MQLKWFFISVVLLLTACTKDYDFKLAGTKPLYVIEGRISDLRGPYFIHITRSTNLLEYPRPSILDTDSIEAVLGAEIIITDDMGTVDTLVPVDDTLRRWQYRYNFNNSGKMDSTLLAYPGRVITQKRGYYQTTKIQGIPGHSYQLHVRIGDSTFQASAYMPRVTTLDSAAIKQDTIVNAAGDRGNLPLVWFKEPQNEKNYYMLQFYPHLAEYPYDMFKWEYNTYNNIPWVLDDNILPPNVNGLSVQLIWPDSYPFPGAGPYMGFHPWYPSHIRLSSLTKEAYDYFTVLRKQLQTDGNVYKPVPASAKGNILGGALGFFWASNISYKLILPK
jgi:hypothetical protein